MTSNSLFMIKKRKKKRKKRKIDSAFVVLLLLDILVFVFFFSFLFYFWESLGNTNIYNVSLLFFNETEWNKNSLSLTLFVCLFLF